MKDILFISDGYGEDTIASFIIKSLADKQKKYNILAFPLVGPGKNYKTFDIEVVGPCREMPSGGDLHSFQRIMADFRAGLLQLLWEQLVFLKSLKKKTHFVVAVGDIYPVLMALLAGLSPIVFMGTAKSDWFCEYNFFEKLIFKYFCSIAFTRDNPTAESLKKIGINSLYVGNPMMDCFEVKGVDFSVNSGNKVIGVLPGSREVAYKDFPIILDAIEEISLSADFPVTFIAALSLSIMPEKLAEKSRSWKFYPVENERVGMRGFLRNRGGIEIILSQDSFGDVINISDILIGQAGTGNEQAAGLGKPVVAFDSSGKEKPGWYRARQKGLLGDSLCISKACGKDMAGEVLAILRDRDLMRYMGEAGRKRMGEAGCIERLTDELLKFL